MGAESFEHARDAPLLLLVRLDLGVVIYGPQVTEMRGTGRAFRGRGGDISVLAAHG